jgi:rod shape-determining protein MreD
VFFTLLFLACIVIIQFFLGAYLSIYKVFPNFVLIAVVYLGVFEGRLEGCIAGFVLGLCWDAFSADIFGMRMLILTVIGFLAGIFSRNLDGEQVYTQFFITFVSCFVYWLASGLIYIGFSENSLRVLDVVGNLRDILCLVETIIIAPFAFIVLRSLDRLRR